MKLNRTWTPHRSNQKQLRPQTVPKQGPFVVSIADLSNNKHFFCSFFFSWLSAWLMGCSPLFYHDVPFLPSSSGTTNLTWLKTLLSLRYTRVLLRCMSVGWGFSLWDKPWVHKWKYQGRRITVAVDRSPFLWLKIQISTFKTCTFGLQRPF